MRSREGQGAGTQHGGGTVLTRSSGRVVSLGFLRTGGELKWTPYGSTCSNPQ